MNAPVYPKSLVGTTIYSIDITEGDYNETTEEYEEIITYTAGEVIGISLDDEGDFYFLVQQEDGSLSSWSANSCTTVEPEATT